MDNWLKLHPDYIVKCRIQAFVYTKKERHISHAVIMVHIYEIKARVDKLLFHIALLFCYSLM